MYKDMVHNYSMQKNKGKTWKIFKYVHYHKQSS